MIGKISMRPMYPAIEKGAFNNSRNSPTSISYTTNKSNLNLANNVIDGFEKTNSELENAKKEIEAIKDKIKLTENKLESSENSIDNLVECANDARSEAKTLNKKKWIAGAAGVATVLGAVGASAIAPFLTLPIFIFTAGPLIAALTLSKKENAYISSAVNYDIRKKNEESYAQIHKNTLESLKKQLSEMEATYKFKEEGWEKLAVSDSTTTQEKPGVQDLDDRVIINGIAIKKHSN